MALKNLELVQAGERTNTEGKPVTNRLLLAIPDDEYSAVRPHLEYVALERHNTLHEPNETPRYVYFPNVGLLSLVVVTVDGKTVEAGIVGREGIVGLASAVGLSRNPLREIVQIAGNGFKIAIAAFKTTLPATPQLRDMLSRYAVLHSLQVSQTAACNRLHGAPQRLARWLLMTQDRVDSGVLEITHDFLATMLGTDRPSITVAASQLQGQQLIGYSRGSVKIVNRKKLEKFACECYGVVQQFNGDLGLK
jgi:CRP-like cAMP-binding protein